MMINIAPFQYSMLENEVISRVGHKNIGIIYALPEDVPEQQVKQAVQGIFELFPALSSTFEKSSGEWQAFLKEHDISSRYGELECDENESFTEATNRILYDYSCHLDVANGPLSRFILIKKGAERKILFIGNHLVYDKLSLRNIEACLWKLLYNKTNALPKCRFLDWTEEVSHYFYNDFHNDIPYWLETDWGQSARVPAFIHQENKPATRANWTQRFSPSASQALLSAVGGSVTLIDLLLAKLNLAVYEFTSSPSLAIELWNNGRDSLKDRSSVGPYASFWPLFIERPSGTLLNIAQDIAGIRSAAPPKYGYLLGKYKKGNARVNELFQHIPSPQFKINFIGHISSSYQSMNKLSRVAKIPSRIPIDHSAYSHISLIFSVEDGIVTMDWSHSSAAYRKEQLQQIAQIMTSMPV
ncbi:condensation domain-containing protein [Serratia marcescens]|nr:condensation domain-containing protein [Serratia marcescens]